MTADWTLPRDLEDELTAEHVPKLGVEPFWRQVKRFIERHAGYGTVDTEAGFAKRLRGWLDRADDNRSPGPPKPPAGLAGSDPPQEPPMADIAASLPMERFVDLVTKAYETALRRAAGKPMSVMERANLKATASAMKIGKANSLGIERGETWTVDDVLQRLCIPKPEAA